MSRFATWRRRLSPVAFGVAIALLARESCVRHGRTHATVVLDFGDAEPRVQAVDAELFVDGESQALFHRAALPGHAIGPATFAAAVPTPNVELRIDVDLGTQHRKIVRTIHVDEGAVMTVPLGAELR